MHIEIKFTSSIFLFLLSVVTVPFVSKFLLLYGIFLKEGLFKEGYAQSSYSTRIFQWCSTGT